MMVSGSTATIEGPSAYYTAVDLVHEAGVSDGVAFFVPRATMIVGIAGVPLCAHGVSQEGDKCCPDGTCVVFSIGLLMVGEIYKKGFL